MLAVCNASAWNRDYSIVKFQYGRLLKAVSGASLRHIVLCHIIKFSAGLPWQVLFSIAWYELSSYHGRFGHQNRCVSPGMPFTVPCNYTTSVTELQDFCDLLSSYSCNSYILLFFYSTIFGWCYGNCEPYKYTQNIFFKQKGAFPAKKVSPKSLSEASEMSQERGFSGKMTSGNPVKNHV